MPIDFAFILDGSGSISSNNWIIIKNFVKQIVDHFEVSTDASQFAILEYSSEAKVYLRFNDFSGAQLNGVNVKRRVEEILQSKGQTFIDKALILANQEIFTERNGMRPGIKRVSCPNTKESEANSFLNLFFLNFQFINIMCRVMSKI